MIQINHSIDKVTEYLFTNRKVSMYCTKYVNIQNILLSCARKLKKKRQQPGEK